MAPNTTEYQLISFVFFQNTNFVVDISDGLFKIGKSVTQWYCVIPGMLSVLCRNPGAEMQNAACQWHR